MKINIQELLSRVDEKNRYYILIGILVLFFLLDYFFVMRPQLVALTKIRPEIKILLQDIQTAQNDMKKINAYQNQVSSLEEVLKKTSQRLKSKDDVSTVLERLSRLAEESDVKIDQVTPLSQDEEILLQDTKRIYYSLPVLFEARSGYHNFGRFLNRLEQDELFFNILDFSVVGSEDTRFLMIKLSVQTVVYEDKAL